MGRVIVSGGCEMKEPSVNPVGTWLFNETITPPSQSMADINFTCSGENYNLILYTTSPSWRDLIWYGQNLAVYIVADYTGQVVPIGWQNQVYRTITVQEPVTDEFFTWLQANAVKQ